ncbi:MAG: SMP-30/gluconolactonase/LRE family protein [Cyanobacteria bacterium P01_A01_bin.84]
MKPSIIADFQCHNAECPIWHPQQQCLYWTDIPRGMMFRYWAKNGNAEQVYSGEVIGGLTLQTDGSLLLFKERGKVESWYEGKVTTIISEIPEERNTRFNDAIADPRGRAFSGTMATSKSPGRLYRIDVDGSLHLILEGLTIPNGMGFTPDLQYLYFTDSEERTIYRFDYDIETGNISNQKVHIVTPKGEGVPDGLTVDTAGHIWSARWDGEHLYRYTPLGEEVLRIKLPARKVTSMVFGGFDYSQLYITTAGGYNRSQEGYGAGSVFQLPANVRGVPEFRSRIGIV